MLWETWLFSTLYFENLEAFKRNWDLSPFSLKDFSDSVDCLLSISTNFACFSWIGYMAYTMHIVARKKNKSLIFSYILPYWKNMSVKMVKLVVRIYKQYMVGWGQHEKELKSGGGGEENAENKYGKVVILYQLTSYWIKSKWCYKWVTKHPWSSWPYLIRFHASIVK